MPKGDIDFSQAFEAQDEAGASADLELIARKFAMAQPDQVKEDGLALLTEQLLYSRARHKSHKVEKETLVVDVADETKKAILANIGDVAARINRKLFADLEFRNTAVAPGLATWGEFLKEEHVVRGDMLVRRFIGPMTETAARHHAARSLIDGVEGATCLNDVFEPV